MLTNYFLHPDEKQGALAGILMGLAQLNQSELRLKRLYNKHGMLGIDRVLLYAIQEWTRDIKRHQLPSLLGGVGPMHSVIQLCKPCIRYAVENVPLFPLWIT